MEVEAEWGGGLANCCSLLGGLFIVSDIGTEISNEEVVRSCDVVILATPLEETAGLVVSLGRLMKEGSLLVDICSVKSHLKEAFEEVRGIGIDIVSVHPLFGPGGKGRVVVIPVAGDWGGVVGFLEEEGFEVVMSDIEEHDREMAKTQLVFRFVNKRLAGVSDAGFHTNSFRKFTEWVEDVEEAPGLFDQMCRLNPHFKSELDKLIQVLESG